MATFLVLIFGDERRWAAMSDDEAAAIAAGHRDLIEAAGPAVLATRELEPASRATTVRADPSGLRTSTEGPFVEGRASVGGYYLIAARDVEEVVGWTSRLHETASAHGGVEIRRVQDPPGSTEDR